MKFIQTVHLILNGLDILVLKRAGLYCHYEPKMTAHCSCCSFGVLKVQIAQKGDLYTFLYFSVEPAPNMNHTYMSMSVLDCAM